MQHKHLREKASKLIRWGFTKGIGPAVLTDFILLFEKMGTESGMTGTSIDITDSSQNNKRAQECASLQVILQLSSHFALPNRPQE